MLFIFNRWIHGWNPLHVVCGGIAFFDALIIIKWGMRTNPQLCPGATHRATASSWRWTNEFAVYHATPWYPVIPVWVPRDLLPAHYWCTWWCSALLGQQSRSSGKPSHAWFRTLASAVMVWFFVKAWIWFFFLIPPYMPWSMFSEMPCNPGRFNMCTPSTVWRWSWCPTTFWNLHYLTHFGMFPFNFGFETAIVCEKYRPDHIRSSTSHTASFSMELQCPSLLGWPIYWIQTVLNWVGVNTKT